MEQNMEQKEKVITKYWWHCQC